MTMTKISIEFLIIPCIRDPNYTLLLLNISKSELKHFEISSSNNTQFLLSDTTCQFINLLTDHPRTMNLLNDKQ